MKIAKLSQILYLFFLILSISGITGCGDDNTNHANPPGNTSFISGTISNYPGGSIILKAKITGGMLADSFFVGIDTVDNNAQFSMDFSTPPSNFLRSFNDIGLPPGVVVSDTTTRAAQVNELRAYGFSNELLGVIRKKNFNDTTVIGSLTIQYLYSTKTFTITGADTNIGLTDTLIITYNASFASGWNAFTYRVAEKRTNFERDEIITGETAGADWRYEAVSGPRIRNKELPLF